LEVTNNLGKFGKVTANIPKRSPGIAKAAKISKLRKDLALLQVVVYM